MPETEKAARSAERTAFYNVICDRYQIPDTPSEPI